MDDVDEVSGNSVES